MMLEGEIAFWKEASEGQKKNLVHSGSPTEKVVFWGSADEVRFMRGTIESTGAKWKVITDDRVNYSLLIL